ncbi:hypothetical protein GF324_05090 [bacterium]|nr:hypothetical protein [bacterium]
MRRLLYVIREGIGVAARSGVAGWLTVLSFAVLAALGSSLWTVQGTLDRVRDDLLSLFELELFLTPEGEPRQTRIAETAHAREHVNEVEIITKEEAARRFSEEYGDELFALLEENPLPTSIIVRYEPSEVNPEFLQTEAEVFSNLRGVDEVLYEGELLSQILAVAGRVQIWLIVIALAGLVLSTLFAFQAMRASVRAGRTWVRAVSLIGGTPAQLQNPFLFAGGWLGAVGGFFGGGAAYVLQWVLSARGPWIASPSWIIFSSAVLFCMIIGVISARFAAPRPRLGGIDLP